MTTVTIEALKLLVEQVRVGERVRMEQTMQDERVIFIRKGEETDMEMEIEMVGTTELRISVLKVKKSSCVQC